MKRCYRILCVTLLWLSLGLSSLWGQDEVTYGFIQDPGDPLLITAVAYPNYSSTNVTISTAVFSFLLPAGTVTDPSIPPLQVAIGGSFNDINGVWFAQLVQPATYTFIAADPNELMGNDVYQVALQNSPSFSAFNPIVAGTPIELFSFRLPSDCMSGNVEVLTNDGAIQQSIFMNLGSNFNNQMSMSINDAPAIDIYAGNDPASFSLPCALDDVPVADDDSETTDENTPVNIDILANDGFGNNGPEMGPVTITVVANNGTAVVNDGGTPNDPTDDTIDYTPDPGFTGVDVLTYEICDADGDCDDAVVTITVLDALIGVAKEASTPVDNLDGSFTTTITFNVENLGAVNLGDVQVTDDLSAFGTSVALMDLDAAGEYTVSGLTISTNSADALSTNTNFNGAGDIELLDVTAGGTLAIGETLTLSFDLRFIPDQDTYTNVAVASGDVPANDDPTGNPDSDPDDTSDDSTDGDNPDPNNNDNPDENTPTPINPNDVPVAEDDSETTDEDTPVNIAVLVNDDFGSDGPNVGSITVLTQPANGTAVLNDGGTPNDPTDDTVDYTPDPDYNGPDSFTYEICDSNGDCDPATVDITINPVNDVPVAEDDSETTDEDTPVNIAVLVNDDFGGDGPNVGSITVLTQPANGTAVLNDGGTPNDPTDDTVDYTPDPDYNGPDSFTYEICDSNGDCDPATVDITINPVNDVPVAEDDSETTDEDTPVNIAVLVNDDFGGDGPNVGSITVLTQPANGTAVLNDGGTPNDPTDDTVDYTPDPDYNGPDSFTYEICDSNGDCDPATVNITIDPVNDVPVANDDSETTDEDTPVNIAVLVNDDFGGDGPNVGSITVLTQPANGTAVLNDGGTPNDPTDDTVDYTPNPNYNGPDSFTYEICDVDGDCDPATVDITINPVNDLPVANDDSETTDEDTPLTIDPLPNDDFGGDGPGMGPITIVTPPTNGTATVDDNGTPNDPTDDTIDYTPDPDYNGPDVIVYEICDANGDCEQGTINITVDPVNDLPVANDDSETTDEDTPVNIAVLVNDDFGGDGPNVGSITVLTQPANGTAVLNDGGTPNDPTDDTVDYTPDPDYNGPDSFTYEICDSNGDCDPATVDITINPVNDVPVAEDDSETTDEDTPVNIAVLVNDDFGGDGPNVGSITVLTQPANGTAVLNDGGTPNDPTDDTVDYTPDPDYNGADSFTYEICDSNGDCDPATVDITINPVNDVPVAEDDSETTDEDTPVNIDPLVNDDFGGDGPNVGSITVLTQPANGTAVLNDGGTPNDPTDDTVDYTPDPDYNGPDSFTYEICDSNGDCDPATVDITVNPVNDLPVANDDSETTDQDVPVNIAVLVNDDFGGDGPSTGSITVLTQPANGTAVLNDGGTPNDPTDDTVDYTPDPGYFGTDQFTYEICDSNGDCDPATVDITIDPTAVKLLARVRLQGALLATPDGLMRDDLRSRGFIPAEEPYTALGFIHVGPQGGTEVIGDPGTVFADNGSNSVVDWVFVELRSDVDPATVLVTRSGLVQRDGDIVDLDGVSPLCFEQVQPGSFYVAVRHRNHIGTMTESAIPLTAGGTLVDFTDLNTPLWNNTANFDGVEQITVDGAYALWCGNTSVDRKVVFAGQDNDKDPIFNEIDQALANILNLQTFIFPGYHPGDVNLNGDSIYAGQNNDVDPIFNNVDGHPVNILKLQTFVIPEQLAGN